MKANWIKDTSSKWAHKITMYFDNASISTLQLALGNEPTWNIIQNILNATLYPDWKKYNCKYFLSVLTEVADKQTLSDAYVLTMNVPQPKLQLVLGNEPAWDTSKYFKPNTVLSLIRAPYNLAKTKCTKKWQNSL